MGIINGERLREFCNIVPLRLKETFRVFEFWRLYPLLKAMYFLFSFSIRYLKKTPSQIMKNQEVRLENM